MKNLNGFRQTNSGAALIEFALVTPILILVLVACLDFARALNAYVTIANAAREGARYATLHPAADTAAIRSYLDTRIVPLDPASRDVVLSPAEVDPDPRWTSAAPAPVTITVEVGYRWDAATWLVGSFFDATGGRRFVFTSAMQVVR